MNGDKEDLGQVIAEEIESGPGPQGPTPSLFPSRLLAFLRRDRNQSLRSQAGRGARWSLLSVVVMRIGSIGVTALLARLLTKDAFGVFAVALAVFLVVSSLAELGMASAIARTADEPDDIAPTIASISILTSVGLAIALFLAAPALSVLLGQPAAAEPIRILSGCLALTGVFAVPGAQLVREFRQDRIFLAAVVGFVVSNPVLVVLALNGGGADSFAWSRVAGQLATGLVLVISVKRRYRPGWRRSVVGPLLRFGLPLSLANLVNWSLLNADYLIVGRVLSAAQVGTYMIAFNVANWSTAVMGSVLNSVVVPTLGRLAPDPDGRRRAVISSIQLVGLLAIPIGTVSVALAGPLVTTVFGARWTESAGVLQILASYGVLYSISLLLVNVLVSYGSTLALLLVQIAWVVVLVPAMLLGVKYDGLRGAAWAHVAVIVVVALPAYLVALHRSTGLGLRKIAPPLLRPLVGGLLAGVVAWLVSQPFDTAWVRLILGGGAAGVVYVVLTAPILARHLPDRALPGWVPASWRQPAPTPAPVPNPVADAAGPEST